MSFPDPTGKQIQVIAYDKNPGFIKADVTFRNTQKKDFADNLKDAKSLIPQQIGTEDGDIRGDNIFKTLYDCNLTPSMPHDDDFGRLIQSEMPYFFFPGNMLDVAQRSKKQRVQSFPLTESEIARAYIHCSAVDTDLLADEEKIISGTDDLDILAKLIKNQERKSIRKYLPNDVKCLKNTGNNHKRKQNLKSCVVRGKTDRRCSVSNRTKYLIYSDFKSGLAYDDLVKKQRLKQHNIVQIVRRVMISGPEHLFQPVSANRIIYADASYRQCVREAAQILYPNNTVPMVRDQLDANYNVHSLSDSTILRCMHSLNLSFRSRTEVKRQTNSPRTKQLRKQTVTMILNQMKMKMVHVFQDESPLDSNCQLKKSWKVKNTRNYFEKEQNSQRGQLLICAMKGVKLPIIIHNGTTTNAVVWSQLRYVFWQMVSILGQSGPNICLVMDPAMSHIGRSMVEGLYSEFNLGGIVITAEHSPSTNAAEILIRQLKSEVQKMPTDHSPTQWTQYVDAQKKMSPAYFLYSVKWFVSCAQNALNDDYQY